MLCERIKVVEDDHTLSETVKKLGEQLDYDYDEWNHEPNTSEEH